MFLNRKKKNTNLRNNLLALQIPAPILIKFNKHNANFFFPSSLPHDFYFYFLFFFENYRFTSLIFFFLNVGDFSTTTFAFLHFFFVWFQNYLYVRIRHESLMNKKKKNEKYVLLQLATLIIPIYLTPPPTRTE